MMKILAVLFLIVGMALASPKADQYIDGLLNTTFGEEVKKLNLDPIVFPDFSIEFENQMKVLGKVMVHGEFFKGLLKGVSKAKRHSECQIFPSGFDTKTINCSIAFPDLKVSFEGKVKYGMVPKMKVKAKSKFNNALASVEIIQRGQIQPALKTFSLLLGDPNTKLTGLGLFNTFIKPLEDSFVKHVKSEIENVIKPQMEYAFSQALSQTAMPAYK